MAGEELQELARVALIGIHRRGREATLAGKRLQPALAGRLQVGFCGDEEFLHWQRVSDWNMAVLNE
jgi:hypothetical protein